MRKEIELKDKVIFFRKKKMLDVKVGDLVQLQYLKGKYKSSIKSQSLHYRVMKKDPTGSGRIIGSGEFEQKGHDAIFSNFNIYKIYNKNNI